MVSAGHDPREADLGGEADRLGCPVALPGHGVEEKSGEVVETVELRGLLNIITRKRIEKQESYSVSSLKVLLKVKVLSECFYIQVILSVFSVVST